MKALDSRKYLDTSQQSTQSILSKTVVLKDTKNTSKQQDDPIKTL